MSESQNLLLETAERAFASMAGANDALAAWRTVKELGFIELLTPEADGGFGGDWGDAFALVHAAGAHAVALPIGEAIVASRLIHACDFASAGEAATLAPHAQGVIDGQRFTGVLSGVGWSALCDAVVFELGDVIACAQVADADIQNGANPAGEPRATLHFSASKVQSAQVPVGDLPGPLMGGAFVRTAQIAGALDAALAMSINYANERQQFGKPIGKFQAVQQALAIFAEEAAAAKSAGQAAAHALDRGDGAFEVAAAKLRANMAAAAGAAGAHQAHGAIGFTQDYPLHPLTRRLVSWRSEFGGERFWAEQIGGDICARGADALWPFLTTREPT